LTRLDSLTGLRFIAAAMIVVHHIQGLVWLPTNNIGGNLSSGVSFFFCLSGFVLHYANRRQAANLHLPEFYFVRFMRLWPAHLAGLLLVLIIFYQVGMWTWLINNKTTTQLLSVIFLMQAWVPNSEYYFAWNDPSWSISTEFAFYLAFPLLCRAVIVRPLFSLAFVYAIIGIYLWIASTWLYAPAIPGNVAGLAYINPIARFGEFAIGVVACEYMLRRKPTVSPVMANAMELALVAAVIVGIWFVPRLIAPWLSDLHPVVRVWANTCYLAPIFCMVIAVYGMQKGWLSRALAHPVLVWLGNISFALYLVHQPILKGFARFAPGNGWVEFPIFVVITLLISAAIYHGIEMPALRAAKRWVKVAYSADQAGL